MHNLSGRAARLVMRRGLAPASSALLACLLALAAPVATADPGLVPYNVAVPRSAEGDTVDFAAYELVRYDSNLFHLPEDAQPVGLKRRSAFTSTTALGAHVDETYGLQRVVLDASVNRDTYPEYRNLDYTGYQLDGLYAWKITPELSGNVIYQDSRLETDFEYAGFQTEPDSRRVKIERLDVDLRAGAALHPRLTIYRQETTGRDATFQLENSRSTNLEGALVYVFKSENSAQVYYRHATGTSDDQSSLITRFADRTFAEDEFGVRAAWQATGALRGDARLGERRRGFSEYSVRDYEGVVGAFHVYYALTDKTEFQLLFDRTLYTSQETVNSYYVNNLATATVAYRPTEKITVRPAYIVKRQDFRSAPIDTTFNLREITRYETLQVEWAILRSIDLSFEIGRSTRSSSLDSLEFNDRSASVFARFKF